jgi:saccharopine dehydrogenase (NAD+, L-lysine-forming)
MHLILRDEVRETERRTPLLPAGALALHDAGCTVSVERSLKRTVPDEAYAAAGCKLVAPGSWTREGRDTVVLGLKELPDEPDALGQTHVYFAHAYKDQAGWRDLLGRFGRGDGTLLDLEYLVDGSGRRVAAFGYWAGYLGAALALIHWCDRRAGRAPSLADGLSPFEDADILDRRIEAARKGVDETPRSVVIGALGRSGRGATALFERHGCPVTLWDQAETDPLDRKALLDHDILVNCVLLSGRLAPFLMPTDLKDGTRLSVVSDVSCDPTSPGNPLPFYEAPTSWTDPFLTINGVARAFDLIAIDNLPSLLPRESSDDFAEQLLPHLLTLPQRDTDPVWQAARRAYDDAVRRLEQGD